MIPYKNGLFVAVMTFIILCIIFYIFKIGYTKEISDGKIVYKFSFNYPLAISLAIWVIWYFFLYPNKEFQKNVITDKYTVSKFVPYTRKVVNQKINMNNWN